MVRTATGYTGVYQRCLSGPRLQSFMFATTEFTLLWTFQNLSFVTITAMKIVLLAINFMFNK